MRQLIKKLQRATELSRSAALQSPLLENKSDFSSKKSKAANKSAWKSEEDEEEVPEGFLPVYVGQHDDDGYGSGCTRFIINATYLSHPIFAELLQISEQEFGYEHQGVLRIPCDVMLFEHIVRMLNCKGRHCNLRLKDMTRSCSF